MHWRPRMHWTFWRATEEDERSTDGKDTQMLQDGISDKAFSTSVFQNCFRRERCRSRMTDLASILDSYTPVKKGCKEGAAPFTNEGLAAWGTRITESELKHLGHREPPTALERRGERNTRRSRPWRSAPEELGVGSLKALVRTLSCRLITAFCPYAEVDEITVT